MGEAPSCRGRGRGRRLDPSLEFFLLSDLNMEHFGAVFKLNLTEETRTQLGEEEEAIASSCFTGYAFTNLYSYCTVI